MKKRSTNPFFVLYKEEYPSTERGIFDFNGFD